MTVSFSSWHLPVHLPFTAPVYISVAGRTWSRYRPAEIRTSHHEISRFFPHYVRQEPIKTKEWMVDSIQTYEIKFLAPSYNY